VNLVEVEFLPGGELIATDNWYQMPAGGDRDALVDCAPGGLYPYAPDRGTALPRTGVMLPPLTLLPAVAHSGVMRPRGTGVPPAWRNSVFSAQHNTRKVVRHELHRAGSTFASTNVAFIFGEPPDFHPSDVIEDADGSLLIVDTGGWYVEHCPTGRIRDSHAPGGIYRVRWKGAPKLADPRGRSLNWSGATSAELAERLRDTRPIVAQRAAAELVRRRAAPSLSGALRAGASLDAQLHALWSLAQVPGAGALGLLREQLNGADATLVCAAARALGLREDKGAGDSLARLLDSTNPPVRRAAAEALAVCGLRSHAPQLVSALAGAGDAFEEHACILALRALADEPFLRGLLKHDAPRVRQAALHLLDQPPFTTLHFVDLVAPLGDNNAPLRAAARQLLERHRDWAGDALPWLREQLVEPDAAPNQAALADLFAVFQSNPAVRRLIAELLAPDADTPDAVRAFLLGLLPSLMAQKPEPAWLRAIPPALTNATLRAAALGAAAAFPQPEWEPALLQLADDTGISSPQRLFAARVSSRHPVLSEGVLVLALASLEAKAGAADPSRRTRCCPRWPGRRTTAPGPHWRSFSPRGSSPAGRRIAPP
jgi:HEAT repeat protein